MALAQFVWRELSTADPVLELRVFRSRDVTLAVATQWAAFGAIFGTFLLVPLFLQQVQGYGAFATGLFTLPQAIAAGIFMQLSGRAFDRVGARLPVVAGLTLVAVAMWQLSGLTGATTGDGLRLSLFLLGAGMGTLMTALNPHILSAAPHELIGRVTSLTQALQNVVASLAIATFATILQARLPAHVDEGSAVAAFGDVYRVALVIVLLAWCLAWGLRRPSPVAVNGPALSAVPERGEREPVLAG